MTRARRQRLLTSLQRSADGSRAGVLLLAAMLVGALLGAAGLPGGSYGPAPVTATAVCTGWTSDTSPPNIIRVLRTAGPAAGTVELVPFHDYVAVVMAGEWGAQNPAEVLKAGAVAAREYGWYRAMFWRGGKGPDGACYDVADSTVDQLYAPESRSPSASHLAAVDGSWGVSLRKADGLFATHYDAGRDVACGANANGSRLYQISARHCAEDGMPAVEILRTYYGPDLTVVGTMIPTGPGQATRLLFTAQPAEGAAGDPLPVQPVVTVVDVDGNPVTTGKAGTLAVTLSLAAGAPGATLQCAGGLSRAALKGVATFHGCTVDAAGTATMLAATATGVAGAATAPFTVSPPIPKPSVAAPSSITWGSSVRLAVHLAPPAIGADVGGRTVQVQRSIDARTWTTFASVATDASGRVSLPDRPAYNLYYRVLFDGAPDLGPATSPVVRMPVRQLLVLRPASGGAARTVARGTKVAFTALVRPARKELAPAQVLFRVYQMAGGTWALRRELTVPANAAGSAVLPVTFVAAGHWAVRAMALPTSRNANSVWSPPALYDVH